MGLGIWRKHQVDCGKLPTDASEGRTHPPVPQTLGRGVRSGEKEEHVD